MSSDPEDDQPDLDTVKAELATTAYNSVAKILKYLASYYGGYFDTEVALNLEFLNILSTMIGDMLAHFPENSRDDHMVTVLKTIAYAQDMAETELAQVIPEAKFEEVSEIKKYDLAHIKPVGNC